MSTTARLSADPLSVVQQLSLARNRETFARDLEQLAVECLGQGQARFFRFRNEVGMLMRPWESQTQIPLGEETLPGRVALYLELTLDRRGLPVPGLGTTGPVNVGIPVMLYGALVGVLVVVGLPQDPDRPTAEALFHLGRAAGVAWEFIRRTEDQVAYAQRVEDLLVGASESLTPGRRGHTMRVARLATELATLMDLSAQSRNLIWRSALYHDVGKLVLAGQLEGDVEKGHPVAGAEFLRSGRVLRELAPIVEAHHERYDGSGFPHGRKGDEVPIEAWVLALAEHLAEEPQSWSDVEGFLHRHEDSHHPAVADALGGVLVSGRLGEILG
ncbi:MAG: hypothetical protein AMXMBFR33_55700 [Candidatus Xenobia bacterium]